MTKFNEIELRGKLRAKFEIETNDAYINIPHYCAWLEEMEINRQLQAQETENISTRFRESIVVDNIIKTYKLSDEERIILIADLSAEIEKL